MSGTGWEQIRKHHCKTPFQVRDHPGPEAPNWGAGEFLRKTAFCSPRVPHPAAHLRWIAKAATGGPSLQHNGPPEADCHKKNGAVERHRFLRIRPHGHRRVSAGPAYFKRFAAATTACAEIPSFSITCPPGALNPKRSMPTTAPSSPT